jgi:hypothetical protein
LVCATQTYELKSKRRAKSVPSRLPSQHTTKGGWIFMSAVLLSLNNENASCRHNCAWRATTTASGLEQMSTSHQTSASWQHRSKRTGQQHRRQRPCAVAACHPAPSAIQSMNEEVSYSCIYMRHEAQIHVRAWRITKSGLGWSGVNYCHNVNRPAHRFVWPQRIER